MAIKDRIQVRIDHETKKKAEDNLKAQGLTLSEYTRIMVANAAQGNIKLRFETPNAQLESSIKEAADFLAGKEDLKGYTNAESLNKELLK